MQGSPTAVNLSEISELYLKATTGKGVDIWMTKRSGFDFPYFFPFFIHELHVIVYKLYVTLTLTMLKDYVFYVSIWMYARITWFFCDGVWQ